MRCPKCGNRLIQQGVGNGTDILWAAVAICELGHWIRVKCLGSSGSAEYKE